MEVITSEALQKYVEEFSCKESDLFKELDRVTHLKTLSPGMLAGPHLAQFLCLMTTLTKARKILEIGTFTGYSTLTFAEAMGIKGKVHTIESDEEVLQIAKSFFKKSGLGERIELHVGDAIKIIPKLPNDFDLVFIDGSKKEYSTYYDLVFDKIRPGGIIIADNVLWYGRVLKEKKDPKTKAIHEFNLKVQQDKRVLNILIPFGDGVNCILKI